jgi:DNA topoisomerase-3
MKKLLNEGKTDLLPRFISKKGKPFAARLFIKETGDIGFEFQNSTANKDKTAETNKTSTPTKPKKTKKSKEKSETSKPPTNH